MATKDVFSELDDPFNCLELMSDQSHYALSPKFIGNFRKGVLEQLESKLKLYSDKYVD